MSDSIAEPEVEVPATPGISHFAPLTLLDQTGLPSWQIGVASFLAMALTGILSLIISRVPNPSLYPIVVAFVAIIVFFLVLYLELARGWYRDLKEILEFDPDLLDVSRILVPGRVMRWTEMGLALACGWFNLGLNDGLHPEMGFVYQVALIFYWLQYLLVFFCIDTFVRQLLCLYKICARIRISLLEADQYAVLANPMLRFLRLYILGLCIVFASYTVFTSGELGFGAMLLLITPFYVPGLLMLALFMFPYNRFKQRIHVAKTLELNHVQRALVNRDKAHLASTLIGEDAERLTSVDLLYYENRIEKIKELPFTDRIRGMLLFGVLPPLTWVIAALIEIFIEAMI